MTKETVLSKGLVLVCSGDQYTLLTESVTWYGRGELSISKDQAESLLKAFGIPKLPTLYGMFFPNHGIKQSY